MCNYDNIGHAIKGGSRASSSQSKALRKTYCDDKLCTIY